MGFQVEINSILRSDEHGDLKVGETRTFRKSGSRVFFDDIPIWLTRSDWTALAEIQVVSQSRTKSEVKGEFQVLHLYSGEEQQQVTEMFRRMYADGGNPFIYILMSPTTMKDSLRKGIYAPDSLSTERFIHASPANQLTRLANKYYMDNDTVHIAVVRKTRIVPTVKWEPATGGLYPHIYGELNMDASEHTLTFFKNDEGKFDIKI
jgi:uncharacterized protein (DUF952 family)